RAHWVLRPDVLLPSTAESKAPGFPRWPTGCINFPPLEGVARSAGVDNRQAANGKRQTANVSPAGVVPKGPGVDNRQTASGKRISRWRGWREAPGVDKTLNPYAPNTPATLSSQQSHPRA